MGFGRAENYQRHGPDRKFIKTVFAGPKAKSIEKDCLMTTQSSKFYKQLGFEPIDNLSLLILSLTSHADTDKKIENQKLPY